MMKRMKLSWEAVLLGAVAIVAGVFSPLLADANAEDAQELEGKIVEIAPTRNDDLPTVREESVEEAEPTYWIGVRGRNVEEPVLRTQFQLGADMGIVVEEVVKGSPAAEAGLRQHDIVLRVNGEVLQSMGQLKDVVGTSEGKPIELLLIRLGKEETLVIVPGEMPADMRAARPGRGLGFDDGDVFGMLEGPMNGFRMLPGGGFNFNGQWQTSDVLPGGYSVTITRQNNEPAKVVVKKGDETWTIEGDDQEALDQLPEEIRDQVAEMIENPMMNFNFGNLQGFENFGDNFRGRIPQGMFRQRGMPEMFDFGDERRDKVLERMEELERQLQDLRDKFDGGEVPE